MAKHTKGKESSKSKDKSSGQEPAPVEDVGILSDGSEEEYWASHKASPAKTSHEVPASPAKTPVQPVVSGSHAILGSSSVWVSTRSP